VTFFFRISSGGESENAFLTPGVFRFSLGAPSIVSKPCCFTRRAGGPLQFPSCPCTHMPRLSDPGGAPCIYAVNAGHYCLPLRPCVDFRSVSATPLLILADHNYTIFQGSMTRPACSIRAALYVLLSEPHMANLLTCWQGFGPQYGLAPSGLHYRISGHPCPSHRLGFIWTQECLVRPFLFS
jgi:hypothetical protein